MTSLKSSNEKLARAGITVAAALCTCLFTYGASAGQPQTVSVAVSYADLDLSKPAGAETLYKRLRSAALKVCKSSGSYRYMRLTAGPGWQQCYQTAMAEAVAKVNTPVLTALHQQQSSKTVRG